VLGCAGTGKTTFARKLSDCIGARYICLDEIWQPSWSEADVPKFRALVADRHSGDAWISDGNFALATFDIRLPRADLIVWLERPRIVCAWRAVTRVFRSEETHALRNLPKVLAFIRNFDRVNRPLIEKASEEHGYEVPIVRLCSDRETDAFFSDQIQA
jgi:adenylate kinase family enzyme